MVDDQHGHVGFWRSRAGVAALVFGVVAAFFLFSEHRAHALGLLPYVLLLACPLMHLFMHHGLSHGYRHGGDAPGKAKEAAHEQRPE